jgi:4-azaleucine resistance transporter AzlC
MRQALPVVFGYVPIGFAYGVLGTTAGVPTWAIAAMSVMVYAGSAQLVAVSLLGSGAPAVTIVATTFLLNLRHVLYGSALSPYLAPMSRGRLAWVAAELTDESFVMATRAAARRPRSLSFSFMAGLQGVAQISWIAGSLLGAVAGSFIGDPLRLGLDYALVAMFVGLLALQLHGRREIVVAVVGGAVSLGLRLAGVGSSGVIVATLVASLVGLALVGGAGEEGEAGGAADAEPPAHKSAGETATGTGGS